MKGNIFLKTAITEEQEQNLIWLIKNRKFDEVEKIANLLKRDRLIGKFPGEHRFIFALNPDLYSVNDMSSIMAFLNDPSTRLVVKDNHEALNNSDGTELSISEFIKYYKESEKYEYVHYGIADNGVSYYDVDVNSNWILMLP